MIMFSETQQTKYGTYLSKKKQQIIFQQPNVAHLHMINQV